VTRFDYTDISMSLTNFCAVLAMSFAITATAATLPAGTTLQARLHSEASSQQASGQPVSAVVIAPVFVNGVPVLSAGTVISGNTADTTPYRAATDDSAAQSATLRLNFTRIQDQAGHVKPISCVLESVDNARETVDTTGLINGIDPSQTYEAQLDKAIGKLQSRSSGLAQLLAGVEAAFVKQVDANIDYKPGVEVTLKLTAPLDWTAPVTARLPDAITPASSLVALVNSEPFRTVAQNPPEPSDITNIMLLGTAEQIQAAFQSAGWFAAAALNGSSKMETARALIENRGYSEAPMSILYLEGRPPDLALQKQNDTFAMRHHIRIWQTPQSFNGEPVWVAAATHDIKITFSPASRSFAHGIDPNIDLERAKVVSDLLFTGSVRGLSLVQRSGIPKNASNATGDPLITDGKMAVVEF
jgi:hypothetical protein